MTRVLKNMFIIYMLLAFFGPRGCIFGVVGFLTLRGLNKVLENDSANRFGFGIFCSMAVIAIGYLIKLG